MILKYSLNLSQSTVKKLIYIHIVEVVCSRRKSVTILTVFCKFVEQFHFLQILKKARTFQGYALCALFRFFFGLMV